MTRAVVGLIARLRQRPAVLISGSAIGWYGLWQDETLTEFDGGKRCFSHRLCEAWEREAKKAQRLGVRVVRLRIGLVLGIEGGMLSRLLIPFEFGLGGPIGSGRQWMSWIERDDLVRLIAHVIATPSLTGAGECDRAGAGARTPSLRRTLGGALRRPALLRMPAAILHHLAGAFADELLLGGQRVIPDKAQAERIHVPPRDRAKARSMRCSAMRPARPRDAAAGAEARHLRSAPAEQPVDQPSVETAARLLRSRRLRAR